MAYNGAAYSGTAHTPAAAVTAAVAAAEAAGTMCDATAASKVLGVLKLPVVKQQSLRSHTGLNWQRLSGSTTVWHQQKTNHEDDISLPRLYH